jgi:hypothetical protein
MAASPELNPTTMLDNMKNWRSESLPRRKDAGLVKRK